MTCFSIQKFTIFSLIAAGFLLAATPASAQTLLNEDGQRMSEEEIRKSERVNLPIVVELFTASDCSACVLADRVLYDAMKDKNVIALSCHMKDFANTGDGRIEERGKDGGIVTDGPMDPCVFRQWAYKSSGRRQDVSITIPEFIINGQEMLGVESMALFGRYLDNYHYSSINKTLEVLAKWKDKDTITIHLPQGVETIFGKPSGSVWIIRYKDMAVERIDEGVNRGKVLRFSNIVQDIRHVGKWRGDIRSFDVDVAPPQGGKERGGYAIVVQEMMGRPMLAAGMLPDYPMPNDIKPEAPPAVDAAPQPAQ